jgi:hypothetical protein
VWSLPHKVVFVSGLKPHPVLRRLQDQHARARELMAAPLLEVNPPAAHDTVDPDAITDHRLPCPCCGGRMMIVEVFARGGTLRGPPSGARIKI